MRMVDVSYKPLTLRYARAEGFIRLLPSTVELIRLGKVPKGDVLKACEIAAMMGGKLTSQVLPFCHPVPYEGSNVESRLLDSGVFMASEVWGSARTGFEMEALFSVSAGLLTVFDMCKGFDSSMVIEGIRIVKKIGGKSDWGIDLRGKKVAILGSCEFSKALEERLKSLGVLIDESFDMLISFEEIDIRPFYGLGAVLNFELFSKSHGAIKDGIKVGEYRGKTCVILECSQILFDAFLELLPLKVLWDGGKRA
ncbi:MAG: cyclic pyranopterin monophosphate synthase MoaC [Aquificaceae bacterium]